MSLLIQYTDGTGLNVYRSICKLSSFYNEHKKPLIAVNWRVQIIFMTTVHIDLSYQTPIQSAPLTASVPCFSELDGIVEKEESTL